MKHQCWVDTSPSNLLAEDFL